MPVGFLTPTPHTPSPCARGASSRAHQTQGEGVGFFKGDGGGFASPIPFVTPSPLSARHLQDECALAAERGVRGVRPDRTSKMKTHTHLEG